MPDAPLVLLGLVIFAALAFDFINGFHDTANAIATCISTRALSIRSAILMAAGTAMGIPISTTHVITSAILGVGLSQGRKKVNWSVGIRIVWAWILTIPASAAAGYFAFRVLSPFLVKL